MMGYSLFEEKPGGGYADYEWQVGEVEEVAGDESFDGLHDDYMIK